MLVAQAINPHQPHRSSRFLIFVNVVSLLLSIFVNYFTVLSWIYNVYATQKNMPMVGPGGRVGLDDGEQNTNSNQEWQQGANQLDQTIHHKVIKIQRKAVLVVSQQIGRAHV